MAPMGSAAAVQPLVRGRMPLRPVARPTADRLVPSVARPQVAPLMVPVPVLMVEAVSRSGLRASGPGTAAWDATLDDAGLPVTRVGTANDAMAWAGAVRPCIVVIAGGLPDAGWMALTASLRRQLPLMDIGIAVVAGDDHGDRAQAMGAGADLVLGASMPPTELAARLSALARRLRPENFGRLRHGPLEAELADGQWEVRHEGVPVRLQRRELLLLLTLLSMPRRPWTREDLLVRCWGPETGVLDRNLDVHVGRIRRAIGDRTIIETMRSRGYRLRALDRASAAPRSPVAVHPAPATPPTAALEAPKRRVGGPTVARLVET